MDIDKVLLFVEPRRRADLLVFLKTAIADDDLQQLINGNVFCQQAIEIFLKFQDEVLLLAEYQKRLNPKLQRIKPRWQAEFLRFLTTQEFSPEFAKYVEEDVACQEVLESVIDEQKEREAVEKKPRKHEPPENLSLAEVFSQVLEEHRQRWARLDNLY